jgi:hypothetical protein
MNRLTAAIVIAISLPAAGKAAESMLAIWTDATSFNPSVAIKKDASAGAAWRRIVPPKYVKSRWVYMLEGNFSPVKVKSDGGVTFVVGSDCKPYDCGEYNNFFVIEPGGHRAFGAVLLLRNNVPYYEYFGNAGPMQHEWLREEIADAERAMSINAVVR